MKNESDDGRFMVDDVAAALVKDDSADALARVMRDYLTTIRAAATLLQSPFVGGKDQLVRLIERHGECLAYCLQDLEALHNDDRLIPTPDAAPREPKGGIRR